MDWFIKGVRVSSLLSSSLSFKICTLVSQKLLFVAINLSLIFSLSNNYKVISKEKRRVLIPIIHNKLNFPFFGSNSHQNDEKDSHFNLPNDFQFYNNVNAIQKLQSQDLVYNNSVLYNYSKNHRKREYNNKHSVVKRGIFEKIYNYFLNFVTTQHTNKKGANDSKKSTNRKPKQLLVQEERQINFGQKSYHRQRMNWIKYHTLPTIYSFLRQLALKHDKTITIHNIGKSTEGRDILLAQIGTKKPYQKPAVFIEGGIHAREWISPATVTFFINELVTNQRHSDLIDFYDFYILPVSNPDGYVFSQTSNRLWRKNRSKPRGIGANFFGCRGVDLNRNFGYHWNDVSLLNPQGGTQMACMETHSGPKPFSEPETKAIADFVFSRKKNIVAYLAYHSYGQKILYPWSYSHVPLKDTAELHKVASKISDGIYKASKGSFTYNVGSSSKLQYLASGGSDDWARGEMGIKWVFLIELPDRGLKGFLLPARKIWSVASSSLAGLRSGLVSISKKLV